MKLAAFLIVLAVSLITTPGAAPGQPGFGERAIRAYVCNFGGDGVSVIDPAAGALVAHVKTGAKPHGVGIGPSGREVYVTNEGDGTLSFIDAASSTVTHTLPVGKSPHQLAVSVDGKHIFVPLNSDNAVAVVDAAARNVIKTVPVGRAPHIVEPSADGTRLFVTCEGDMKVVEMDAKTFEVAGEIPIYGVPRVPALSADGKTLYQSIRWLNGALVIDTAKRKAVNRVALGEVKFAEDGKDAHGLALTADGAALWITTQTTDTVTIVSTSDLSIAGTIAVGRDPNWIAFTPPDHSRPLAVVSNTGSNDATIIDAESRKVAATIKVGPSPKRLAVGWVEAVQSEAK